MVEENKTNEISTDDFVARMQARLAQYDTVSIKQSVDTQVSAFKSQMDRVNDALVNAIEKQSGWKKSEAQNAANAMTGFASKFTERQVNAKVAARQAARK